MNANTPATDRTAITGYRTNEDGTETLAYDVAEDGTVTCVHTPGTGCCTECFEADQRLYRNVNGVVRRLG